MINDILLFVVRRLFTRAFWLLVLTHLLTVMMWELRGSIKDHIFQEAVAALKADNWKHFRGGL